MCIYVFMLCTMEAQGLGQLSSSIFSSLPSEAGLFVNTDLANSDVNLPQGSPVSASWFQELQTATKLSSIYVGSGYLTSGCLVL